MGLGLAVIIVIITALIIWAVVRSVSGHFSVDDTKRFKDDLWTRYLGKPPGEFASADTQNADRLLTYTERIIDRQINKARGILPFNSLIMAFLAFQRVGLVAALKQTPGSIALDVAYFLLLIGLVALFASSLFCLYLFLFHWGSREAYKSFDAEISGSVVIIQTRAVLIQRAIALAALGLVLAALSFGIAEYVTTSVTLWSHCS